MSSRIARGREEKKDGFLKWLARYVRSTSGDRLSGLAPHFFLDIIIAEKDGEMGHPDMMSASEGGGGHGKADVVRKAA